MFHFIAIFVTACAMPIATPPAIICHFSAAFGFIHFVSFRC